jgi:tripartite-type tricarboxylate transporter receptor subunit TctC
MASRPLRFALYLAALLTAAAAHAQPQPFAGKTVHMVIGLGVGGGYDLWGRLVARHISKHLPGQPTVVPQNMPGAGSFVAAAYLNHAAPRDGTAIGIISRDAVLGPLTGATGARFDPTQLSWIGSPTTETNICIAFHTAKVKTVQDLLTTELIVGDTGPGTGTRAYPRALTDLLSMRFKVVSGFRSSADVFLAMERGEVEGICESLDSVRARRPDWIPTGKVSILFQAGAALHPDLKGVPSIFDLAKTEEQKLAIELLYAGQEIGRPFVAPPGLAPERLKMVRDAFDATMRDPQFADEARRNKFEVDPVSGDKLTALIQKIYATPKPIVERIGNLIK